MRIAVYGGSFDPPHVGHLMVASWLRWTGQADAVWLVVSHDHPFGKDSAPFDTRLEWCRRAAAELPGVAVSDVERQLPPPSYTLATLEALARAHPQHTFRFVLGSDAFATVGRWHRWDEIERRFAPIVVARAGHLDGITPTGPVFPEVSSSDVRDRARRGDSIADWVPFGILDLVVRHYSPPGEAERAPSR